MRAIRSTASPATKGTPPRAIWRPWSGSGRHGCIGSRGRRWLDKPRWPRREVSPDAWAAGGAGPCGPRSGRDRLRRGQDPSWWARERARRGHQPDQARPDLAARGAISRKPGPVGVGLARRRGGRGARQSGSRAADRSPARRFSLGRPAMAGPERLQKYLARCGVASRRAAERLIVEGRVAVNGVIVATLGATVDPARDRVEVGGESVAPPAVLRYVLLNKPPRVVSTASDPRGRRTVVDLAPTDLRLFPVGRLDFDSEGAILLTNDGELAFRLTHPRHKVEKEYRVLVRGGVGEAELERLRSGVPLDGSPTAAAKLEVTDRSGPTCWLRLVIHEGRNRQIRRMAEHVGLRVERLIRTRIGPIGLCGLRPGAWRELRPEEVAALRRAAG